MTAIADASIIGQIVENRGLTSNPWGNLAINAGVPLAASAAVDSVKNRVLRGLLVGASVIPGMTTNIMPDLIEQFKEGEWADLIMTGTTGAAGIMAVFDGFTHDRMDKEFLQSFGVLMAIFSAVGMFEDKQEGQLDEAVEKERSGFVEKIQVERFKEGEWKSIPLTDVEAGDEIRFVGEMMPVDGVILGVNEADESAKHYLEVNAAKATGQAFTSLLREGSEVLQGSVIMQDNAGDNDKKITLPTVRMRAGKSFGESSVVHSLNVMIKQEEEIENNPELKAQLKAETSSKVRLEKGVNVYILGLMLPLVLGVGGYELFKGQKHNGKVSHHDFRNAIRKSLTTAIRMAPCPIMAVPFINTMANKYMLDLGIHMVNKATPEHLDSCDTVVFDLTGTITSGTPKLAIDKIITIDGNGSETVGGDNRDTANILRDAALLERFSTHPIAFGLHDLAKEKCDSEYSNDIADKNVKLDENLERKRGGISGAVSGRQTKVGNEKYFETELKSMPADQASRIKLKIEELAKEGMTAVIAMTSKPDGSRIFSVLGFNDNLHSQAMETLRTMKAAGKKTILMTGDNEHRARAIQKMINAQNPDGVALLDDVVGNCLPEDKAANIKKLKADGKVVAMVGDGNNDAPALQVANTSLAIKTGGADVSRYAAKGGIVDNIGDVGRIIKLNKIISDKTKFFTIAASIWVGALTITEFLPFRLPAGIVSILHEGPTALMLMLTANAARQAVIEVYKDIKPDIATTLPAPMDLSQAMKEAKARVDAWQAARNMDGAAKAENGRGEAEALAVAA